MLRKSKKFHHFPDKKKERKKERKKLSLFVYVCVCVCVLYGVHNECFIVSVGWRTQYMVLLSNRVMLHWWGSLQCINADTGEENATVSVAHAINVGRLIQFNDKTSHRSRG